MRETEEVTEGETNIKKEPWPSRLILRNNSFGGSSHVEERGTKEDTGSCIKCPAGDHQGLDARSCDGGGCCPGGGLNRRSQGGVAGRRGARTRQGTGGG